MMGTTVTRKQAVKIILEYLHTCPDLSDELYKATNLLQEIHENMAWKIWTDETIRTAIDRFIKEEGRPPNTKDLANYDYLPPVPSVRQVYKMPVSEWLRQNYPNNGIDNWQYRNREVSNEELLEWFKAEYKKIQPITEKDFRQKREKGTPSWRYIANRLGINSWRELIRFAELDLIKPSIPMQQFKVHSNYVYKKDNNEVVVSIH